MTISGLAEAGGILGDGGPRVVQIDVSHLAAGTLGVIAFDLLGFAAADSRVVIDNVYFTSAALRAPVAGTDLVTTDEDVAVRIAVLANDTDAESELDPASVAVVAGSAARYRGRRSGDGRHPSTRRPKTTREPIRSPTACATWTGSFPTRPGCR